MIKFIIDSTIDLTNEQIKKYNIDMVSLQVIIDGKTFRDRKEIDIHELYTAIRENKNVSTSLPIYNDMYDLFEGYAKTNQPFIFYTFSAALSGTYNASYQIVEELKEKYPNAKMAVINSKNGGTPAAIMALDILEKINTNPSFEEVIELAEDLSLKMENLFLVNDLTQLKKGGRISGVKQLVGSILNIKPILLLVGGAITQYKSAIGLKRALAEMVDFVEKNTSSKDTLIGINYSANEALLDKTKTLLEAKGYKNFVISRIASVMTAHIGLDAVSLSFYKS